MDLVNTEVDVAANSLSWFCCQNKFRHVISIKKCEVGPIYEMYLCCSAAQDVSQGQTQHAGNM
jgi:hypothetical protein